MKMRLGKKTGGFNDCEQGKGDAHAGYDVKHSSARRGELYAELGRVGRVSAGAMNWAPRLQADPAGDVHQCHRSTSGTTTRRRLAGEFDDGRCAPVTAAAGVVAPAGANAILARNGEGLWRDFDEGAGID